MNRIHLSAPLTFLALFTCACGGGGGGSSGGDASGNFDVQRTRQAVGPSTPVIVGGRRIAYLASEAGTGGMGTDWNEDGDVGDLIFVTVDTKKRKQKVLDTAAETLIPAASTIAYVGSDLFMIASEANDTRDWNMDLDMTDMVLLHWAAGLPEPELVDEIGGTGNVRMLAVEDRLFFLSDEAPTAVGETNLRVVSADAPLMVEPVATTFADPGMDGITVCLAGVEEGLVALFVDENVEGEITGDADGTDANVLCLLDGTTPMADVLVTSQALSSGSPDWRAVSTGSNPADWLVAFLVDETAMSANLNDPVLFPPLIWQPAQCALLDDTDTDDEVLHWIDFASFSMGMTGAENTGLVGTTVPGVRSVVIANGYVGTVSLEEDEGDQMAVPPGCDLNMDGDKSDRIFRWTRANVAAVPEGNANRLHALVSGVPGGTAGVLSLGNLFVILVDEAADGEDIDGDLAMNKNLIGAYNPANNSQWNFDHGSFVGGTWMAEDGRRDDRFFLAFPESIEGFDLNGDGDTADSVPTFPERGSGLDLDFPGIGVAVAATNAGITAGGGTVFYRVSEADDGLADINGDGDAFDFILERGNFSSGTLRTMGTLNAIFRDAVELTEDGTPVAGAFLAHEAAQGAGGTDFNDDGDTNDWVVSYFEM